MMEASDLYTDVCSICSDTLKTCITLSCKHVFCYLCIKAVLQRKYSIGEDTTCPLCRSPVDNSLLENASAPADTLPPRDENFAWMYQGRNGGWWYYQHDHNIQIENAYQSYIDLQRDPNDPLANFVDIEVCSKPYTINFETMQQHQRYQTNVLGVGYYRNIKRVDKFDLDSSKGVAGVKYVKNQ